MVGRVLKFFIIFCTIFNFGCACKKNIKSTANSLRNLNYVEVRAISGGGVQSAGEEMKCSDGRAVYVSKDILLGMNHFETGGVYLQPAYSRIERYTIVIPLTGAAAKILEDWTSENIPGEIGIFIDGNLAAVAEMASVYSGPLLIEGEFPRIEAEKIRGKIASGGKP